MNYLDSVLCEMGFQKLFQAEPTVILKGHNRASADNILCKLFMYLY